jgi:redox-sensitive bicupin YhaK (pirin superfamily)
MSIGGQRLVRGEPGAAHAGQLALMGDGESFAVVDADLGTRYLLMTGKPHGEAPRFNGPFVDEGVFANRR